MLYYRINCIFIYIRFVPKLADCLEMMYSYDDLCMKLETMRAIRYDSENQTHEGKVLK